MSQSASGQREAESDKPGLKALPTIKVNREHQSSYGIELHLRSYVLVIMAVVEGISTANAIGPN